MDGLFDYLMTNDNPLEGSFSPVKFIFLSIAGFGFIIFGVQVIFPKISIPVFSLVYSALSLVDFISHEFGHIVSGFLGEFIGVLGGTAAQLFLPAICLFLTFRRKQWKTAAVFTAWVGENLVQISTYIRDAQSKSLKLFSPGTVFGGESPIHDWNYLLGRTGLLWADQFIGWIVFSLGMLLILLAAGYMFARGVGFKVSFFH